ncbi:MAG: hypothetical protein HQL32_17055, partial [Planctomycetes bacterium]|nr:hypothetical protein [Planctomycetota bacterium]
MKIKPLSILLFFLLFLAFSTPHHAAAKELLSLDGKWEIVFDHDNMSQGVGKNLPSVYETLGKKRIITVPSAWELIEQDYEGVAVYKHTFEIPSNWNKKIVRLHFGAVNYRSEVWLNDEAVGFHEGGFTPFEFRVDKLLKGTGKNTLLIRVLGPIVLQDKEIDGIRKMETPQWRAGLTGGIWQSVNLIATDRVYVDDIFIEPKLSDNSANFHVTLDHTGIKKEKIELEVSISEVANPSGKVVQTRLPWNLHPGINRKDFSFTIQNPKYWSPDAPNLYKADVKVIVNNQESDHWSDRFGMRELTIRNKDFYLNGKPIYIKATFFEALYPNMVAFPDSIEMARREIKLAKDAGFNMIRPWRRPSAPIWLDLADEMGVLVVGSPTLECMTLPLSTAYLPKRVESEIRESVLRDRNRACIVQWELFNELHRPVLKQMMRPMAMLARELDPSRLILDESGGWAYGASLYLPCEYEPIKFNDIHNYPGPFINNEQYDGYLSVGMTKKEKDAAGLKGNTPGRNVIPGLMSFISELGYGSLPNLVANNKQFEKEGNPLTPAYRYHRRLAEGQKRIIKESGFEKIFPDLEDFCLQQQEIHGAANKRMIEGVRANPDIDGYCIHALSAGDWILGAGLIDLWRNPKTYAYEATKAANQP